MNTAFSDIIGVASAVAIVIALALLQNYATQPHANIVALNAGPEKKGISANLKNLNEDARQILTIIEANPSLEIYILSVLSRRSRFTKIRQLIFSITGNSVAIIAGWLLSNLVNPAMVFGFLK